MQTCGSLTGHGSARLPAHTSRGASQPYTNPAANDSHAFRRHISRAFAAATSGSSSACSARLDRTAAWKSRHQLLSQRAQQRLNLYLNSANFTVHSTAEEGADFEASWAVDPAAYQAQNDNEVEAPPWQPQLWDSESDIAALCRRVQLGVKDSDYDWSQFSDQVQQALEDPSNTDLHELLLLFSEYVRVACQRLDEDGGIAAACFWRLCNPVLVLSAAAERPGVGLTPEHLQLFQECLAAGSMQRLDDATHIKQINCIVRGLLTSLMLSSSLQEPQQVATVLQPLLGKTLQLLDTRTSSSYISTVQHLQSMLSMVAAINLRARETAAATDFERDWSNPLLLYYVLELANAFTRRLLKAGLSETDKADCAVQVLAACVTLRVHSAALVDAVKQLHAQPSAIDSMNLRQVEELVEQSMQSS